MLICEKDSMSELEKLYKAIAECRDCELANHRTKVVPGEGPENPQILFIGEAPGWHEDQQGRPFVGAAGQYLEQLLLNIGLSRNQVYIANVIKCRPPSNRDPFPSELKACNKWLDQQISLLKPRIIVTLGRYSMAKFFPNEVISRIHGKARIIDGVTVFPMYHPAAALHQYSLRKYIEEDINKIPELLKYNQNIDHTNPQEKQLSLF